MAKSKYDWRKYYYARKERLAQENKTQSMGSNKTKTQSITNKKFTDEKNWTPAQRYYYRRKAKLEAEAAKKNKVAPKAVSKSKKKSSEKINPHFKDTIPVKIVEVKRAGGIATMYYGATGRMMYSSWVRKR